jgi:hypothetical protein
MSDLATVIESARAEFARAQASAELEDAKARYLGKSGRVTEQLKALGALSPEEKKARGAEINAAKQAIEAALGERRAELAERQLEAQLAAQSLDVTLPGRSRGTGGIHPVMRTWMRIEEIFAKYKTASSNSKTASVFQRVPKCKLNWPNLPVRQQNRLASRRLDKNWPHSADGRKRYPRICLKTWQKTTIITSTVYRSADDEDVCRRVFLPGADE